jgi:hypothetical protein
VGALSVLQHLPLQALVALFVGALVLVVPRVLNYAIGAYLLFVGAMGMLPVLHRHGVSPQAVLALIAGILVLVRPNILNYVIGAYLILVGLLELGVLRI